MRIGLLLVGIGSAKRDRMSPEKALRIALAKALNAKVTVITVTEPLPVDYRSEHASGWIPTKEEVDSFDAACKERAGKVLDEVRVMTEQIGICSECAPSRCW
jgi:hypothetical protein